MTKIIVPAVAQVLHQLRLNLYKGTFSRKIIRRTQWLKHTLDKTTKKTAA